MPETPSPDAADDFSPSMGGSAAGEGPQAGAGPGAEGFQAQGSAEGRTAPPEGVTVEGSFQFDGELGAAFEAVGGNLARALEQAAGALERDLPSAIDRLGRSVPDAAARLEAQLPQALGAIERLANVFETAFSPLFRPVAEAVDRMVPPDTVLNAEGNMAPPTPQASPAPAAPPARPSAPAGDQDIPIPVVDEA